MPPRKKKAEAPKQEETPKVLPDQKLIEEKLTTARIGLLIRQPFFGSMATRLKLVRDDNMPTAATDGRHFYYNLEFIAKLTTKETEFLFGHEVLHNVFEHHLRKHFPDGVSVNNKSSRHHMAWNVACDYVINNILIESNIGDKIEDTLHDDKYKGMCAEQVYDDLMKNCSETDLCSLADKLLDEHMDSLEDKGKGLSEEEKQQIKNEIKESLLASAQAAAGNVPAGVERFIKSFTQPTLSWKEILRQDIQSIINKTDYSFYNPAKKGRQQGIVLPGMLKQNSLDICIAIDTSGSISDNDLQVFLGEISGIMEQYEEYTIRIWSFDTKVYNDETFRSDEGKDITEYNTKGGGGTDFECNWNYMKDNEIQPKIFIMFTDMQPFGSWGDETYCDEVIFVGYKSGGKVAPFGTTITMS